jgi:hypothetical protein
LNPSLPKSAALLKEIIKPAIQRTTLGRESPKFFAQVKVPL